MGLPAAAAYALPTSVKVLPVDSASSCIRIETPDRPGLLMEIANVLTDISDQILSADIHTEVSQTDDDQAEGSGAQVPQALPHSVASLTPPWPPNKTVLLWPCTLATPSNLAPFCAGPGC